MGNLAKMPIGKVVFDARMRAEGKGDQFDAKIQYYRKQGMSQPKAFDMAAKDFGYNGTKREKVLKALESPLDENEKHAVRSRIAKDAAFEAAIVALPVVADRNAELDWVRRHPAMNRLDRMSKDDLESTGGKVIISVADITRPPHGQCPSQGAARDLQHWSNRPEDFYNKILAIDRRTGNSKKDEEAETKVTSDPGIEDVEKMLAELRACRGIHG